MKSMESNVIYALWDANTPGEIRYVGQTREGIAVRFGNHKAQATHGTKSYVYNWIRNIGIDRLRVSILSSHDDASELNGAEIYWIDRMREIGMPLTNTGNGGSSCWTGQKRPAQSLRMAGSSNPMFGRDRSEVMRYARSFQGPASEETRATWSKNRKGSGNANSKLEEQQAREIFRRSESGESRSSLAREYGVSTNQISHIALKKSWKHIHQEFAGTA